MGKKKSGNNKKNKSKPTNGGDSGGQKPNKKEPADSSSANSKYGNTKKGKSKRQRNNGASKGDYNCQLRQLIEADGKKSVIEMSADGNCLFRSLSDQLFHDYGNNHEEVRADICDYLEHYEEDFSVFLVLDEDEEDEDAASYEQYVENMRQPSEWGGNVELVAAARLYRRNITVYSASLDAFTIDHGHETKGPAGPTLLLSYHDNDHYNSVREHGTTKPPPPIKTFVKQGAAEQKARAAQTETCLSELPTYEDSDNEQQQQQEDANKESLAEDVEGKSLTENVESARIRSKQPKKSTPCPCGSGLRYKKCCWVKENKKGPAQCKKVKHEEEEDTEPVDGESASNSVQGDFRVMKI